MLYLVLLLVLYPFMSVTGINLTYIVKKENNVFSPSCIAEELERYDGIGWIYPIPNSFLNIPTVVTKYIPTIENDFNCNFAKNSRCNTIWSVRDWDVDFISPRTKDVITDVRWEDFPIILISNSSKEFENKIELENVFKTAFSVRVDGIVEILICSGDNPYNYPCYYIHIGYREIYLKQYQSLPKDIKNDFKTNYLDYYKTYSNILSHDEWSTLVLSSDASGRIQLIDVNLNRILVEHRATEPITPMFMFMRSTNNSLWKIHENSFFYTNTTQISRFGPQISLPEKDMCISLFVRTCSNCEMIFFYMNSTKKLLKTIKQSEEWMEIKLKEANIQFDKVNIFVETKYINPKKTIDGFWGIDNVRVCNENEIKVSFLKLNGSEKLTEDNITCQLVKKPNWKPKKLTFDKIRDFPDVSTTRTTNSIHLKWPQEDQTNTVNYFVWYQGNDICSTEPYNPKRLKSNGFISTKSTNLILNNLVPYTTYNITISTILHETDKKLYVSTLETVEPTFEELPTNIQLKALDTSINISWENVNCSQKYGRLAYTIIVSNSTLNFSKELPVQTDNVYEITGLRPYTHYTLNILTARNGRNLYKKINTNNYVLNFITMPGVSDPPENLEIFTMDKNSASLRYDLPSNFTGIAREIQVTRCNSLSSSKCKSSISIIKRCSLWPKKYCINVNYLVTNQAYFFKVSLKNLNTHSFGKEVKVRGVANERIPGMPTNITYKSVDCEDYCRLNITWLHPYYQNGSITHFEIILNSTEKKKDAEDDKVIHEIYKIQNNTYYYDYTYQIKSLPYSSYYNLYIRSVNTLYKSDFAETQVKTDNLGDHIDQSPKLLAKSDSTLLFKLPQLDRRLKFYTLTVVVQDYDKTKKVDNTLLQNKKVADNLCHPYGNAWISQIIKVDGNNSENLMIGNAEKEQLRPNTKYCITFIITNRYNDLEHNVVYYEKLKMLDTQTTAKEANSGGSSNHLYMLLLILLLIPVGFLTYRYCRKKKLIKKPMQINEHVYETLPCDEMDRNNGVNQKSQIHNTST